MQHWRRLRAYLELTRPPNLVTSAADVVAGFGVAGQGSPGRLAWLVAASVLLYGGGVVLNDVFDASRDGLERPERPIPGGRVSVPAAAAFGTVLLAGGVTAALAASPTSGLLALAIAGVAIGYDALAKEQRLAGPLCMGSCRALNLLLGISASPLILLPRWPLALIPLVFVAAVTAFSRGEVGGGGRATTLASLLVLAVVEGALGVVSAATARSPVAFLVVAPLAVWTLAPIAAAWWHPAPGRVRSGVRAGVLGLILLDAALAAVYADPLCVASVLVLLPISLLLARTFAVA